MKNGLGYRPSAPCSIETLSEIVEPSTDAQYLNRWPTDRPLPTDPSRSPLPGPNEPDAGTEHWHRTRQAVCSKSNNRARTFTTNTRRTSFETVHHSPYRASTYHSRPIPVARRLPRVRRARSGHWPPTPCSTDHSVANRRQPSSDAPIVWRTNAINDPDATTEHRAPSPYPSRQTNNHDLI